MSYCVNCGVELEKSLKKCPLCGVEAQNPKEPYDEGTIKPYPVHMDYITGRMERRLAAIIITVVLLLVSGICVLADVIYSAELDWALYVLSALALGWLMFVLSLFMLKWHPIVYVILDGIGAIAFLYVINLLLPGDEWFSSIALPIILLNAAIVSLNVSLIHSGRLGKAACAAWVAGSVGIDIMGIEMILDLYMNESILPQWSWFVLIPCLAVSVIMIIVGKNSRMKDSIKRRLHT